MQPNVCFLPFSIVCSHRCLCILNSGRRHFTFLQTRPLFTSTNYSNPKHSTSTTAPFLQLANWIVLFLNISSTMSRIRHEYYLKEITQLEATTEFQILSKIWNKKMLEQCWLSRSSTYIIFLQLYISSIDLFDLLDLQKPALDSAATEDISQKTAVQ